MSTRFLQQTNRYNAETRIVLRYISLPTTIKIRRNDTRYYYLLYEIDKNVKTWVLLNVTAYLDFNIISVAYESKETHYK